MEVNIDGGRVTWLRLSVNKSLSDASYLKRRADGGNGGGEREGERGDFAGGREEKGRFVGEHRPAEESTEVQAVGVSVAGLCLLEPPFLTPSVS